MRSLENLCPKTLIAPASRISGYSAGGRLAVPIIALDLSLAPT
jgi:hypothetical protein